MITPKVEIGFDLGANTPTGFKLDDAERGVLDNTTYILAGELFYDISNRVQTVTVRRGKSDALDRIDAGISTIVLDNNDRLFDPLYEAGLYYGQLVPRRQVRVSANDEPVFYGYVEDFDLEYLPGNRATAQIDIADAFGVLANAPIDELDPPSELSGARVNRVLDLPEVNWPVALRQVEEGRSVLLDSAVEGVSALEYLQRVSTSEFGNLFISKDGDLIFKERNSATTTPDLIFSDDTSPSASTKVLFSNVRAIYGSENLYTRVYLANTDVIPEEIILENEAATGLYGVRTYSNTNLLVQDPAELEDLANALLVTYDSPLYRFEAVTVVLDKLNDTQTEAVLNLEIGDIVQVQFTPSNIPPAIELPCRIIGISHAWEPNVKRTTFSLETLNFGVFVLDSPLLGELDNDRLSY
jgi:hypothetical protein